MQCHGQKVFWHNFGIVLMCHVMDQCALAGVMSKSIVDFVLIDPYHEVRF